MVPQRSMQYYYNAGRPKVRRAASADVKPNHPEMITVTAAEEEPDMAGLSIYNTSKSLKDELGMKSKREVPLISRRKCVSTDIGDYLQWITVFGCPAFI